MIIYASDNIEDYKNSTSTHFLSITSKSVGEETAAQFTGRNTLIKRKLSSENIEFIESLGFTVKKWEKNA